MDGERKRVMKVTYIHHSSFLVELEHIALLFDYFEGELPALGTEQGREKPLFVFASHRHGDHFSPVIFKLGGRYQQVRYILSDDISLGQTPEALREKIVWMGPGETRSLEAAFPGGTEQLMIRTLRSTDEGVAFLIQAEGRTIYHAGDLNDWVWEGEPEEENRQMSLRYRTELEKLKGIPIDLAFMLLDPRQEQDSALGMDEFMRCADARVVFPMHFWGDFGVTKRFRALPCAREYRDRIREIEREGQSFQV